MDPLGRPAVERRRDPRVRSTFPLALERPAGVLAAAVRDVSRSGVSAFVPVALPKMATLRFALDLPSRGGARRIEGDGAVVRCERRGEGRFEIAIFFTGISEEDRRAIEAFVRERGAATN